MGAYPRVVHANPDGLKDLLVGEAYGTLRMFYNVNTDEQPEFDSGTLLQVGEPGFKEDIDVGSRAAPTFVDWNNDGKRDLVVGAYDGRIYIYLNEGQDDDPDYRAVQYAQENGQDLVVPSARSSPCVRDLDGDGKKDLLVGNTEGQLLLYSNVGTDEAPSFSGYTHVTSAGIPIDFPYTARSRIFICDWTDDGLPDVLIGSSDGAVHLYEGIEELRIEKKAVAWDGGWPPGSGTNLLTPYPNPFNPSITVPFVLSRPGRASLTVYDLKGRRVITLLDEECSEGYHRVVWQGEDWRGRDLSSGVYFIRLSAEGAESTRKVVLTK